jgi:transcriptional antiterminator Rof (Rho-off)
MIELLKKLDFKTLMILCLIIIILLLRMCDGESNEVKKGDTIKVNGKKYEVVDHRRDTTYITRDSIVYKKGKDIKVEVKVPVYVPANVDTQEILKDYFSRRFYIDTLDLGQKSFVIVKDTITENKILSRVFESSITERIINDTLFLVEPPKRQMFIGFQMGFDKKDIINYGGLSLLYKDKKDKIFGLGLGINSNSQPTIMGSMNWKIKLKK